MKNYFSLLALAATLAFSSCTKEKVIPNPVTSEPTDPASDPAAIALTAQLLTANAWQLTGLTQNIPGQAINNDIYNNSLPACQRDDVFTFSADKTITIEAGMVLCSTSETAKPGTWNLKNAGSLTVTVPGLTQTGLTGEFAVLQLNNSKMILKQVLNGNEYLATYEKHVPVTKTQLLTAKPWETISIMLEIPGTLPIDISSNLSCEKDNLTQFYIDGIFKITEGLTKCQSNNPDLIAAGNWVFLSNETKLFYDGDEFLIEQLTPTNMVLKYEDGGVIAVYTFAR